MKTIKKIGKIAGLVAGLALLGTGSYFLAKHGDHIQARKNQRAAVASDLIRKCNDVAKGEDGWLSIEDGVKLARSLGYHKKIFPNEAVHLRYHKEGKELAILIGYKPHNAFLQWPYRDKKVLSEDQLRTYLAGKKLEGDKK